MRNTIAVIGLVLALGMVNWSIFAKEQHLEHGKVVYLELAPVDPRSLIQGDYMTLRFSMANEIRKASRDDITQESNTKTVLEDGKAVVTLDDNKIATFHSLASGQPPGNDQPSSNQLELRYRVRKNRVKFATNAFFFQEGHAAFYESARYGEFRVNDNGDVLLTALMNAELENLAPEDKPEEKLD